MNKYKFPFEKLNIWNLAIDLSAEIYRMTKNFPAEERYGLVSQIRRSSNSISANIAEGSGRFSTKDKARFMEIAFSSLLETISHTYLSLKLGFINQNDLDGLKPRFQELSNKINAFHQKLR